MALSHAGIANTNDPASGEDYWIAANVPGIDVIVSGHAHALDPTPIVVHNVTTDRDVLVLNGGAYGKYVGRVDLTGLAGLGSSAGSAGRAQWLGVR